MAIRIGIVPFIDSLAVKTGREMTTDMAALDKPFMH
jgi:hypothetical protein